MNTWIEITKEIIIPTLSLAVVAIVSISNMRINKDIAMENAKLKDEIRLLTENPLTPKNGFYVDESGNYYCPCCRSLMPVFGRYEKTNSHYCLKCNQSFDIPK